jgi:hypothetical protein
MGETKRSAVVRRGRERKEGMHRVRGEERRDHYVVSGHLMSSQSITEYQQ